MIDLTDLEKSTVLRYYAEALKHDPDAVRNDQRLSPKTREFLAELYADYEPHEVPGIIAYLVRVAYALKDLPANFDPMGLSMRDHDALIGDGETPDEIPGVAVPGFADMPLRELATKIGPHEFRFHVLKWGEQIEAEHRAFMRAHGVAPDSLSRPRFRK